MAAEDPLASLRRALWTAGMVAKGTEGPGRGILHQGRVELVALGSAPLG